MALRVLLADESSTIRKVFQLALQDFAVELKTVNIGTDVVSVAEAFKPDIIFVDVILQKLSGYEVASQLKSHASLNAQPVVMMWSSFMELDEDKFEAAGANARLEKPFDVTELRSLVEKLVPKTSQQKLSKFLEFPKMPEFEENQKATPAPNDPPPLAGINTASESDDALWSMDSFDPIDDFAIADPASLVTDKELDDSGNDSGEADSEFNHLSLSPHRDDSSTLSREHADELLILDTDENEDQLWQHGSLREITPEQFADSADLDLDLDFENPGVKPDQVESSAASATPVRAASQSTQLRPSPEFNDELTPVPHKPQALGGADWERIVREEARKAIEDVVWKVVPELAKAAIEKELERLLSEPEVER